MRGLCVRFVLRCLVASKSINSATDGDADFEAPEADLGLLRTVDATVFPHGERSGVRCRR